MNGINKVIFFLGLFLLSSIAYANTYTVTATGDNGGVNPAIGAGTGTLRQAIIDANANAGADVIIFQLTGGGTYTISLSAELPALTDNAGVTIDGFSQAGASPNTIPVFNTSTVTPMNAVYQVIIQKDPAVSGAIVCTGITISSDSNIIKGLVLTGNFGPTALEASSFPFVLNKIPAADILIDGSGNNNHILGCYLGMNADGATQGDSTTEQGVFIMGSNNLIGNGTAAGANLVSGHNMVWGNGFEIFIQGVFGVATPGKPAGNEIKGNIIGLQKDGTTIVSGASVWAGIEIGYSDISAYNPDNNTIGGTGPGEGNVISGNGGGPSNLLQTGIDFENNTGKLIVLGNIIGPRADGFSSVADNPQSWGITIYNSPNFTIGGSAPGAGNTISANNYTAGAIPYAGSSGIWISNNPPTSTGIIQGNYIGVAKDGMSLIPGSSQDKGIIITGTTSGNTIGGSAAGEGNVISGQSNADGWGYGIYTDSPGGNTFIGNIIGPQFDGMTNVNSNQQTTGIYIDGSPDNIIGGSTAGSGNIISANLTSGITMNGSGATGNKIYGNYIGSSNALANIAGSAQVNGIIVSSTANTNFIGGYNPGEANVIAFNTTYGISVNGVTGTNHNLISRNTIYNPIASMTEAINLSAEGNDLYTIPSVSAVSATLITGTAPNNGDSVEVFKTNFGCINANQYLGTTIVSAGTWTLSVSLNAGDKVIADVRNNTNNNTSEFSVCVCAVASIIVTNNQTICAGNGQTLSVVGSSSYIWIPDTGLSSTTGNIIIASPTVTTTYTVIETVCGNQTSVTIKVNSAPTIMVSPNISLCQGSSTTLTVTGASVYTWSPATGVSASTGSSITATPLIPGLNAYTVTGTNITTGCSSNAAITINVNPLPIVSISPAYIPICYGDSTTLIASGITSQLPMSYLWTPPATLYSNTATTVTAHPLTTSSYTVVGRDGNGCYDTASAIVNVSSTLLITISPANNLSICQGTSIALTASGGITYLWTPAIGLNNYTTATVIADPTAFITYFVTGSNGSCIGEDSVTISIYAFPAIIASADISICSGSSAQLSAMLLEVGTATYFWNPTTSPASGAVVNASPNATTTYTVTGTDGNDCKNEAAVLVAVAIPAQVTTSPDVSIIAGSSTMLSATNGGLSYTWSPDFGLDCYTCRNPTASPTVTTFYTVTMIDANGCSSPAMVTVEVGILCGEIFIPDAFSPNGDEQNDILYVGIPVACMRGMIFKIYDRWGNTVFESYDPTVGWDGKYKGKELDDAVFVYYLRASLTDGTSINKKGNVSLIK